MESGISFKLSYYRRRMICLIGKQAQITATLIGPFIERTHRQRQTKILLIFSRILSECIQFCYKKCAFLGARKLGKTFCQLSCFGRRHDGSLPSFWLLRKARSILEFMIMSAEIYCAKRITTFLCASMVHSLCFFDKRDVRPRVWSPAICPRKTLMDHDASILHTRLILFTVNNATPFRPVTVTPWGQQICGFVD